MFRLLGKDRSELLATPLPESWLSYLHSNVFLYRLLSEAEKTQRTDKLDVQLSEMALSRAMARLKTAELAKQRRTRKM